MTAGLPAVRAAGFRAPCGARDLVSIGPSGPRARDKDAMTQLQVLIVDDSADDAELVTRELWKSFAPVETVRVDTPGALAAALALGRWDVVISDNRMPSFRSLEALGMVKRADPDLPFILVTGTMGEDAAVETLKAGVDDYVLKGNLQRLKKAFEAQLQEGKARRERRRSINALQESEQRFRQLAENIDVFFYLTDPDNTRIFYASPAYEKIWGRSLDTLYADPRSWLPSIHPQDRGEPVENVAQAVAGVVERRYRIVRADGALRWVRSRRFPVRDASGETYRIAGIVEDITERKETEERLGRLNRVHAVLSGINSLIVRVRDRQELYREACRIAVEAGRLRMAWLGLYDPATLSVQAVAWHGDAEGMLSRMRVSLADPHPEGRGLVRRVIREKRPLVIADIEHDHVFRLRDEALARGFRSAAVLPLLLGGEVLGVISFFAGEPDFFDEEEMRLLNGLAGDISFALDHIEKEERLHYLALYDGLTGLANRRLFLERAGRHAESAGEGNGKLAVIVADLERFRAVNDSLGRQAGDLLLGQISRRLGNALPEKAELARIGPDQFALALPAVKNPLDTARQLAELSKVLTDEPFQVGDHELRVSAKAGVALFPEDGADAESLLRNAEAALKRCKQTGERFLFFEQQMTERVAANLSLENRLRRAIEREEFVLHYQPRISLGDGRIVGLEALIRWQSEEGLVPPAQFIPLLEETGLILEAGAWALRQAVLDHKAWLERGIAAPRVAVNVSPVQLRQRDFVARVRRAAEQGPMPPMLDLEITESMAMEDVGGNVGKLRAVRELGLGVAVDDFGTGYSSLAYLAKLPVTSLKIDRSFIITMLDDANAMTLVSMIVSLAHSLRLKVTAEGVDSEDQAAALRRLQCDEMQGYLFSRPLAADDLLALLLRPASGDQPLDLGG
jgi:diguanylate cyclase (GGDEF)-like protein/PAS domain S-box-containing protein